MKILVVDDSELWRKILKDLFREHEVEVAADGLEGYFKVHEFCPDVVISDVVMPGLNGYLLCRIVKNIPEFKNMPFILMTASSDSLDKFWGKYSGALEYIKKDSQDGIEELKRYVESIPKNDVKCFKDTKGSFKSAFERAINNLLVKSTIENEVRKFFIHIDDMNYVLRGLYDLIKSMFEIDSAIILVFRSENMDIYTTVRHFEPRLQKIFSGLKTPSNLERRIEYLESEDHEGPYELFWVFHQEKKENGAIHVTRSREFSNNEKEIFSNVMVEMENIINVGVTFDIYKRYSFTDKLTGLNNLRALNDYLDDLWKKNEDFSFCMIDIDDFKKVNDTYGHETGNEVLFEMGNLIRDVSFKNDLFASRFGGEEIAIVSRRGDLDKVIESLRKHIESSRFSSKKLAITISAGISSRKGAHSYTEVIERADMALYRAKKDGKNKVIIDDVNCS